MSRYVVGMGHKVIQKAIDVLNIQPSCLEMFAPLKYSLVFD